MKNREEILNKIYQINQVKSTKLDQGLIQMKLTPRVYNITKPKDSWADSVIPKK